MKTLAKTIKRDGFVFTQVFREGKYAIYDQRRPGAKEPAAFEVIKVLVRPPNPAFGADEDYESYPSSEQWGVKGWTVMTMERAREKVFTLSNRAGA